MQGYVWSMGTTMHCVGTHLLLEPMVYTHENHELLRGRTEKRSKTRFIIIIFFPNAAFAHNP